MSLVYTTGFSFLFLPLLLLLLPACLLYSVRVSSLAHLICVCMEAACAKMDAKVSGMRKVVHHIFALALRKASNGYAAAVAAVEEQVAIGMGMNFSFDSNEEYKRFQWMLLVLLLI